MKNIVGLILIALLIPTANSCLGPLIRKLTHHGAPPPVPSDQPMTTSTTSSFILDEACMEISCNSSETTSNLADNTSICPVNYTCTPTPIGDYCCPVPVPEICETLCVEKRSINYRTTTGLFNNQECNSNSLNGASNVPFMDLLPPKFSDDVSVPLGAKTSEVYNNFTLPNARDVVISFTESTFENSTLHTPMIMQWGQWHDHDVTLSQAHQCSFQCSKCEYEEPCFPVPTSVNDPTNPESCFSFVRFLPVCDTGTNFSKPRRYLNSITAFVDASQVYGDDEVTVRRLRNLTSDSGLLKIGILSEAGKPLMPYMDDWELETIPTNCQTTQKCFVAGDRRTNIVLGLIGLHTIFLREHNRLVGKLKDINPNWDGEKLYQEARKIVGAINQRITYSEYLPELLGETGMEIMGSYPGKFDSKESPDISKAFVGAAFRLHNMIAPVVYRLDENFQENPENGNLLMSENFFTPDRIVYEGGIDPIIRGLYGVPNKNATPSTVTVDEFTNFFSLDVPTLNIHRGRDYGLQPYNEWRKHCNLSKMMSFEDFPIIQKSILEKLKNHYGSPDNIELWIGGVVENILDGSVGPTFACILVDQFKRTRNADGFWYENPGVFSPSQLAEIKKVTLARVLCDNGDDIKRIQENVFQLKDVKDFVSCSSIPEINLEAWKEA